MAITSEDLRRVRGGVGTLETISLTEFDATNAVGDTLLGIKVPAGKAIIAAVVKGDKNLASDGAATIALKQADEALVDATGYADLQGKVAGGAKTVAVVADGSELKLTIAGAALTGGKLDVTVLYM